jgi:hypothetical protein
MTTTTTRRALRAQRDSLSGTLPQMNRDMERAALQTKARHLIDRMQAADREELAEYALRGITYTAEKLSRARAEAAEQYPHATRSQLRRIAEVAAVAFEQNSFYQQVREELAAEQRADAVENAGEDYFYGLDAAEFAPEAVAA